MSESAVVLITISRVVFALVSIVLDYTFLTSQRPVWFQVSAFAGTWLLTCFLRGLMSPFLTDPLLVGIILSLTYLVPFALVFQETFHAKIFVFFMVSSVSLCIILISLYVEVLLYGHAIGAVILTGFLLELACIPLIRKHVRPHVKNILAVINQHNSSFALFPILSFALLAFYGVHRTYLLSTFISLVLCTMVVAFTYYLIALSIDQTKRNRQLDLTSRTDALTGLYNRRHMEQRIQEEFVQYQETGSEFALLVADIDLFKEMNDRYGHACGDALLKTVAEDLRKSVREYDTVGRWGGDEFLLLLPGTSAEHAIGLAERIRERVKKQRISYEAEAVTMSLTLGVAVVQSVDTVASLIKKADLLMYQGKRAGRNTVVSLDSQNVEEPAE